MARRAQESAVMKFFTLHRLEAIGFWPALAGKEPSIMAARVSLSRHSLGEDRSPDHQAFKERIFFLHSCLKCLKRFQSLCCPPPRALVALGFHNKVTKKRGPEKNIPKPLCLGFLVVHPKRYIKEQAVVQERARGMNEQHAKRHSLRSLEPQEKREWQDQWFCLSTVVGDRRSIISLF